MEVRRGQRRQDQGRDQGHHPLLSLRAQPLATHWSVPPARALHVLNRDRDRCAAAHDLRRRAHGDTRPGVCPRAHGPGAANGRQKVLLLGRTGHAHGSLRSCLLVPLGSRVHLMACCAILHRHLLRKIQEQGVLSPLARSTHAWCFAPPRAAIAAPWTCCAMYVSICLL